MRVLRAPRAHPVLGDREDEKRREVRRRHVGRRHRTVAVGQHRPDPVAGG
nr:hypothetical protein [Jiangella alkaliphila]